MSQHKVTGSLAGLEATEEQPSKLFTIREHAMMMFTDVNPDIRQKSSILDLLLLASM